LFVKQWLEPFGIEVLGQLFSLPVPIVLDFVVSHFESSGW